MKKVPRLLLVVLALLLGVALAQDAAESESNREVSAEAREAGVGHADLNGDRVVSHAEADAAFEQLAVRVAANESTRSNEFAELLSSIDDTNLFLLLLLQSDVYDELAAASSPFTVFVPSDSAFSRIDRLQFSRLIVDPIALRQVLENHIAFDTITTADMESTMTEEGFVAGGGEAEGDSDGVFLGDAEVVGPDLGAGNVTVHVIDEVLLPVVD